MPFRRPIYSSRFFPQQLQSLQFLLDTSQSSSSLLTDGAVNLVAASSQSLSIASNASLNFSTQFTVSCWINLSSLQTQVISKGAFGSTMEWAIRTDAAGKVFANIPTSGSDTGTNGITPGALSTSTWNHIVLVFDGTQSTNATRCLIYANGTPQTLSFSGTIPSTITNNGGSFNVGSLPGFGFFNGIQDGLGLWNVALTPTQITALYNSGNGLKSNALSANGIPTPVSYYDFDNPTISSAGIGKDYIGSNNLTPNASPTYVAGKVSGIATNGDAVSSIADQSPANNTASQTTGANRYTLQTGQINGQAALNCLSGSAGYSLLSIITATGPQTLYVVGKRATSSHFLPTGSVGGIQCEGIVNSNTINAKSAGGLTTGAYTGSSGSIAVRFRRDASNNFYFASTGMAEILLTGSPSAGNQTFDYLFAFIGATLTTAGNQYAFLSYQLADTIANGQDSIMRNYINSKFALSIP